MRGSNEATYEATHRATHRPGAKTTTHGDAPGRTGDVNWLVVLVLTVLILLNAVVVAVL